MTPRLAQQSARVSTRLPARQRLAALPLSEGVIRKVMGRLFSRRHDFGEEPLSVLVEELARVGITTRGEFSRLMGRYRRRLKALDRARLVPWELRLCAELEGEAVARDMARRQYFHTYGGLIRAAVEMAWDSARAGKRRGTPAPAPVFWEFAGD